MRPNSHLLQATARPHPVSAPPVRRSPSDCPLVGGDLNAVGQVDGGEWRGPLGVMWTGDVDVSWTERLRAGRGDHDGGAGGACQAVRWAGSPFWLGFKFLEKSVAFSFESASQERASLSSVGVIVKSFHP